MRGNRASRTGILARVHIIYVIGRYASLSGASFRAGCGLHSPSPAGSLVPLTRFSDCFVALFQRVFMRNENADS